MSLEPGPEGLSPYVAVDLAFPPVPDILSSLRAIGALDAAKDALKGLFDEAVLKLQATTQEAFTVSLTKVIDQSPSSPRCLAYRKAMESAFLRQHAEHITSLQRDFLAEVSAKAGADRHVTELVEATVTVGRRESQISAPQSARLSAVFAAQHHVSKMERALLALELRLSDRQIACWVRSALVCWPDVLYSY